MIATTRTPESVRAAIDDSDRFLVQQVFRPIGNEYRISVPAPGSKDEGEPLLFVKQKKLSLKEDIRFNFTFARGDAAAGRYSRVIGSFRDKYVLEPGEALEGVDRRLVLAFAVALDALQDR